MNDSYRRRCRYDKDSGHGFSMPSRPPHRDAIAIRAAAAEKMALFDSFFSFCYDYTAAAAPRHTGTPYAWRDGASVTPRRRCHAVDAQAAFFQTRDAGEKREGEKVLRRRTAHFSYFLMANMLARRRAQPRIPTRYR